MRKIILAGMLLICTMASTAQFNVEMGANNHGARFGAAYVNEETGMGLAVNYNFPIISAIKPNTLVVAGLYEHLIDDHWNATILVGGAMNNYTDVGKQFGNHNKITGSVGLELGWDQHMGRAFISAAHSGVLYIGGGMKIRFK